MTEIVEDVSFPPDSCPEVSLTSSFNKRVLLISESSPIVLHQMHIYLFHLSGLGDAWPINSERKKKKKKYQDHKNHSNMVSLIKCYTSEQVKCVFSSFLHARRKQQFHLFIPLSVLCT